MRFMVLPALSSIWPSPMEPESDIPFYSFETSHAKFPLAQMMACLGDLGSASFSYGATILMYRVGNLLIGNKADGRVAEMAAYCFVIGHHMLYFIGDDGRSASVSIFLTLLALYVLYSGKES